MPITIEKRDYEFLLLSEKFCRKIDQYAALLGLDDERIEAYKTNNQLLTHVFNNPIGYSSFIESFTRVKIQELRTDFIYLEQLCRDSSHYTFNIGLDLGIETLFYAFSLN